MNVGSICNKCIYEQNCDEDPNNSECLNFISLEDSFIIGNDCNWLEMSYFRFTENILNYGQETDWDLFVGMEASEKASKLLYTQV
jgi:hypothetical protein